MRSFFYELGWTIRSAVGVWFEDNVQWRIDYARCRVLGCPPWEYVYDDMGGDATYKVGSECPRCWRSVDLS